MDVNHLLRVYLHLHAYLYVKLQTFEISMFLEVSLHEGILLFILVDILQICQVTISDESNKMKWNDFLFAVVSRKFEFSAGWLREKYLRCSTCALIGRGACLHKSIVCKHGCDVTSKCLFRCTILARSARCSTYARSDWPSGVFAWEYCMYYLLYVNDIFFPCI